MIQAPCGTGGNVGHRDDDPKASWREEAREERGKEDYHSRAIVTAMWSHMEPWCPWVIQKEHR